MKILPPVSIEARRLLPSRWDLLAAVLVLGFLVAFADAYIHSTSVHVSELKTRRRCVKFANI